MNAIYFYKQYRDVFAELDPADCQTLLLMLIDYGTGEEVSYLDLPRHLRPLFLMFKANLDRDAEAYNARRERNRLNGGKGGRPKNVSRETSEEVVVSNLETASEEIPVTAEKPKRTVFIPPTIDECREYFVAKGDTEAEAEAFVDFYQSKGWMVGRNKMKDWRCAVRGWIRRKKEQRAQNGTVERDTRAEAQRAIREIYGGS